MVQNDKLFDREFTVYCFYHDVSLIPLLSYTVERLMAYISWLQMICGLL